MKTDNLRRLIDKHIRVCLGLFVLSVTAHLSAHAQGPNDGYIMESEGTSHLLRHADPIYPPIAKAAHVQGSVLLHVAVDEQGKVASVQAIGGPEMLRGAAIEAVKRWSYRPFETDGKPAAVKVVVTIPFSLGIPDAIEKSDQAISQAFFPKSDECRTANASHKWADAVKPCGEAVTIAERFPDPKSRANELRLAYEGYGEALAYSGNAAEALKAFHKATAVAETSLTSIDVEYAAAYYWQAFAEHASRMPVEAERDYTISETSFRKAILNLPDMKNIYERELAHTLAFHSVLAQQTGREAQAAAMQKEALQLDPHSMDGMGVQK